jgi:hypothetical protein
VQNFKLIIMKKIIFILFSVCLFFGCSNNDSNNSSSTYEYPTRLIGKWAKIKRGVVVNNQEILEDCNCILGYKFNVSNWSYIVRNNNGTYNNPIDTNGTWQIVNNDEIIIIDDDSFGGTEVYKIKTLNSTTLKLYGISSTIGDIQDRVLVYNKLQ